MPQLSPPDDKHWLLKTVLSQKERTIPAALLMSVSFAANGTTPVIIGHAIDGAIAQGALRTLWGWIALLAVLFALNAACAWTSRWLFIRAMLGIGHQLRMALTDRIIDPRGMAGGPKSAGELLSIASTDTHRVATAVLLTVFPAAEATAIIYTAVMVSLVHVLLGLGVLVGGPLVVWVSLRAAGSLRRRSSARQAAVAAAAAVATDVVQGLRILKGLGAISTVRARYQDFSAAAYMKTTAANAAQARLNAITDTTATVYVVVIGLAAGYLALQGTISVGGLITVVGLTQFIITPLTMMGKNFASRWVSAQASAARICQVLSSPPADSPEPELPAVRPGITVISGPAPAGIAWLRRPGWLVVPHQADFFAGSILSNVHPDPEVASTALHVAAAADIPGGLARDAGEYGSNLSGGQRQRVALARALAAAPEVLILQDPTTAVDSVTEQQIANQVAAHRADKVTIIYTSSPAWRAVAEVVEPAAEVAQ